MAALMPLSSDIRDYRPYIQAALEYGGMSHTFEDVCEMVSSEKAQFWPMPHSAIVTEIIEHPREKILHFFLAGGNLAELEAMTPVILDWGKSIGCTRASLIGRKGWERTFLTRTGWESGLVVLEKSLSEK